MRSTQYQPAPGRTAQILRESTIVCRAIARHTGSDLLASVARYAIIVYAAFAALTQLGIAVQLTANTFLILLGAVALAAAIAFGSGGREVARQIIEKGYKRSD
jgi:hypothetical protein